ncbi:type IV toxin-antitoxin system AbiEi family antitoxin [Idiomarina sp. PL1-037]|uniref:type IV toxin-antitoxin system AbiEi family antitoxin n=1 Tax=Idiomarina sp. PL1-037 TaxID=3095365 RepID=UPI003A101E79
MGAHELRLKLHELQKYTRHALLSMAQFSMIMPEYSSSALKVRLNYLVKRGVLQKVCRGVWAFPESHYYQSTSILHLPYLVRPSSINYLSLESVLSKYSVISQQMFDYITVMTTGRSGIFKTSFGTLELTHTKRDPMAILTETHPLGDYPLREAMVKRAYSDLKNVGRNVELVDLEALHEALNEQSSL